MYFFHFGFDLTINLCDTKLFLLLQSQSFDTAAGLRKELNGHDGLQCLSGV